jgi:Tol biopolymer transport system component
MARRTQGTPRALRCLVFSGALLALSFPAVAESAYPGANGRIALTVQTWQPPPPPPPPPSPPPAYFVDPRGFQDEPQLISERIVSVLPNGERQRRLHTVRLDSRGGILYDAPAPAFSPNGKLIAFDDGAHLTIMRHDGTRLRMLPPLSNTDRTPTWSPDGRRLAFSGERDCPLYCGTLYTVRPDGTRLRQVLAYEALSPAWSVRGRIAFLNNDDPNGVPGPRDGLQSVRPDGSRRRRLFGNFAALGNEPDWSPDGRRLVFRARGRLITMNADGSGRRAITSNARHFSHPAWSPNGKYIAAISGGGQDAEQGLYIMRPNGRGLRKVVEARRTMSSDGKLTEWEALGPPSWQPLPR